MLISAANYIAKPHIMIFGLLLLVQGLVLFLYWLIPFRFRNGQRILAKPSAKFPVVMGSSVLFLALNNMLLAAGIYNNAIATVQINFHVGINVLFSVLTAGYLVWLIINRTLLNDAWHKKFSYLIPCISGVVLTVMLFYWELIRFI